MKHLIILSSVFLVACGGDSHVTYTKPSEAIVIIEEPMPGYQPDGTLPVPAEPTEPATEPPVEPSKPIPTPKVPTEPPKPCKAPQASEQGIEHGKPPVDRCL